MENLYDIKLKDNYAKILKDTIFEKGYLCGLELINEINGYFYFRDGGGQLIKLPDDWVDLLLPHTKLEIYPYDLYYLGEKVGRIKWPLQFPECELKTFEVK
jgi:hypothetical protein